MGMFDTFHAKWRGQILELQHKDFGCSLENFTLGDMVDSSQIGFSFFLTDFKPDINHLQVDKNKKNKWDEDRFFIGILHDGYWIDYAIAPNKTAAESLASEILDAYDNPSRLAFAWKSIMAMKKKQHSFVEEAYLKLYNFYSFFKERKQSRRNKGIGWALRMVRKIPSKKELTLKNLLGAIAEFTNAHLNAVNIINGYSIWKSAFTLQSPMYHYDGPEYPRLFNSSTATSNLNHNLERLNLLYFQKINSENPLWWKTINKDFYGPLEKELSFLQKTYWGSMAWLNLRQSFAGMPLFESAKLVEYDVHSNTTTWLHFVEVLGVDEEWIIAAVNLKPEINNTNEPLSPLSLPSIYKNATNILFADFDWNKIINLPDSEGLNSLHRALRSSVHYDGNAVATAFNNARLCIDRGADLFFKDPDGNTPLMWIAINFGDDINKRWIWDPDNTRQNAKITTDLIRILLHEHSTSHLNNNKMTILDLWPKNVSNILLIEEERNRLMQINGKQETINPRQSAL